LICVGCWWKTGRKGTDDRTNDTQKKRSLAEEKQTLHERNEQYSQLVERERTYYKVTNDFEEECVSNRKLLALLKDQDVAQ